MSSPWAPSLHEMIATAPADRLPRLTLVLDKGHVSARTSRPSSKPIFSFLRPPGARGSAIRRQGRPGDQPLALPEGLKE